MILATSVVEPRTPDRRDSLAVKNEMLHSMDINQPHVSLHGGLLRPKSNS